jgi:diguanylate cyclase (GGDEF)-like protein
MLKRSERFQRGLQISIIVIIIAAVMFGIFTFLAFRTNVNVIRAAMETIRGGSFLENLTEVQYSLNYLFWIVVIELIVLTGGVVASLSAIYYLLNIYFGAARQTLVDELTGIYNRRALYKILDQEIKRAERFKHPLTVMMMDLDFFKRYNDRNGHIAGDLLLQKISKIIGSKIRDVDTLARYGGEEFTVVLPETSHESAAKVAERIRKGAEEAYFKGQEAQPNKQITLSIGLVTFHGEYKSRAHLIHSADELLYRAKESGRNRLIKAYFKEE